MEDRFDTLLQAAGDRNLPPVEQWQPQHVGDIDIHIKADGRWFHDGTEIKRQRLVDLFATILRLDADGFCLVTPAEKLRIRVDEAPFIAIDMESDGEGRQRRIILTTNVGDHVLVGSANPITVLDNQGEPRPYVEVRAGLRALIARSVFYRLVDLGEVRDGRLELWSCGIPFVLGDV